MMRMILTVSLVSLCIVAGKCCAKEDPILAKLTSAKDDLKKEAERLRTDLLVEFDTAENAARAAGNKPLVDRLKTERTAFVETGVLPTISAGTTYERAMRAVRFKMEAAYKLAILEYLKVKKDDELAVLELEMKAFQAAKPGAKPDSKDAFMTGTILAGQLKWNGDPGNHNYLIVVTERNGKTFRGVARLDYGPSGDAKRKGLYDIEGEITPTGLKYKGDMVGLGEVEGKWVRDVLQITASAENGGSLSGGLRFKKK